MSERILSLEISSQGEAASKVPRFHATSSAPKPGTQRAESDKSKQFQRGGNPCGLRTSPEGNFFFHTHVASLGLIVIGPWPRWFCLTAQPRNEPHQTAYSCVCRIGQCSHAGLLAYAGMRWLFHPLRQSLSGRRLLGDLRFVGYSMLKALGPRESRKSKNRATTPSPTCTA